MMSDTLTTRDTPKRRMNKTLFTRQLNSVVPMMFVDDRKTTLQAIDVDAVNKAVNSQESNVVLDDRPLRINNSEKDLAESKRMLSSRVCTECGKTSHDIRHIFVWPAHPTTLTPSNLWSTPAYSIRELSYLKAREPDRYEPD